jgi:hypothetical protein
MESYDQARKLTFLFLSSVKAAERLTMSSFIVVLLNDLVLVCLLAELPWLVLMLMYFLVFRNLLTPERLNSSFS